jgi:redox-regulated HSP33 family molecular chaperone
MNTVKQNYFIQIKKLTEQRTTIAHRAIGVLSAVVHMNQTAGVSSIAPPTMEMITDFVKEYDNLSEQIKHTDLLLDLAGQKVDEA